MPAWEIAEMEAFFEEPVELPEEWRKVEPFPEDLVTAGRELRENLQTANAEAWSERWRPVFETLQSGRTISESEWSDLRKALGEFRNVPGAAARFVEIPGYDLEAFPPTDPDSGYIDGHSLYLAPEILCLNSYLLAHDGNWAEAFHPCLTCLRMAERHPASSCVTHSLAIIWERNAARCLSNLAGECDDIGARRALLVEMNRLDGKINLDAFTDPLLIDSVGRLRWYARRGKSVGLESGLTRADLFRRSQDAQGEEPEPLRFSYLFGTYGRLVLARSVFIRDAPFSRLGGEHFYRYIMPNYRAGRIDEQAAEADFDIARLTVAARIEELETGRPPGDVSALVEKYFPGGLTDPFADAAYRRDPRGNTLYSIGPDHADNGNRIRYDPTNGTDSAGDISLPDGTEGTESDKAQ